MRLMQVSVTLLFLYFYFLQCPAFPQQMGEPSASPILKRYWQNAVEESYIKVSKLLKYRHTELLKSLESHMLWSGDERQKEIALTFDDGPHPDYTPKLLAILKKHGVRATFFLVGKMAAIHPDLVRAEMAEGHSIGNHTFHHVNLTRIPPGYVAAELRACGDVLQNLTGHKPHLFRPPGGDFNIKVLEVAVALGYTTVFWTDDPGDYLRLPRNVLERETLERVGNGGIILLHDGVPETVKALPYIIEKLKKRGYRFVTIDQMIK